MDKKYTPAILVYVASALFYLVAAVGAFVDNSTWATWLCLGSAFMLLASSKLTKVGKQLREEEEKDGED